MKFLLPITYLLLLTACQSATPTDSPDTEKTAVFFSLVDYFEQQAEELQQAGLTVEKSITINDEQEVKTLSEIDWQKEFRLFADADINRPAWIEKYTADTTLTDGAQTVVYQALEPELATQEITVNWLESGEVGRVKIVRHTESALADNQHQLEFVSGDYYQINTEQRNRASAPVSIEIVGRFP